jgi:hypothetical protein
MIAGGKLATSHRLRTNFCTHFYRFYWMVCITGDEELTSPDFVRGRHSLPTPRYAYGPPERSESHQQKPQFYRTWMHGPPFLGMLMFRNNLNIWYSVLLAAEEMHLTLRPYLCNFFFLDSTGYDTNCRLFTEQTRDVRCRCWIAA